MAEVAALGISVSTDSAIQALNRLQQNFKRVTQPLAKVANEIKKAEVKIDKFAGKLDQLGSKQFHQMLDGMKRISVLAKGAFSQAFETLRTKAKSLAVELQTLGSVTLAKLTTDFKGLSSEIGKRVLTSLKKLSPAIKEVSKTFKNIGKEARWWAKEVAKGATYAYNSVKNFASQVKKSVAGTTGKAFQTLSKHIKNVDIDFNRFYRKLRVTFKRDLPQVLKKFGGQFKRVFDQAGKTMSWFKNRVSSVHFWVSALVGSVMIRSMIQYADQWKVIGNQIKVFGDGAEKSIIIQNKLYDIAQRSLQAMDATAVTYSRLRRGADELGLTMKEMLYITEAVGKSFVIAGSTAKEARNATYQLSQAFGQGALRGDELRSILEMNQVLAKAIAREFKVLEPNMEATIGKLVELGRKGLLTPEVIAIAIFRSGKMWDKQFGEIEQTVDHATTKMKNSWMRFLGVFDRANGATALIVQGLNKVQGVLEDLGDPQSFESKYIFTALLQTFKDLFIAIRDVGATIAEPFYGGQKAAHGFAESLLDLSVLIQKTGAWVAYLIGSVMDLVFIFKDGIDLVFMGIGSLMALGKATIDSFKNGNLDAFREIDAVMAKQRDNFMESWETSSKRTEKFDKQLKKIDEDAEKRRAELNKGIIDQSAREMTKLVKQKKLEKEIQKIKKEGTLAEKRAYIDKMKGAVTPSQIMNEQEINEAADMMVIEMDLKQTKAVQKEILQLQKLMHHEIESQTEQINDQLRINKNLKIDDIERTRQLKQASELRASDERREKLFREYKIGNESQISTLGKRERKEIKAKLGLLDEEHELRKEMIQTELKGQREIAVLRREQQTELQSSQIGRQGSIAKSQIQDLAKINALELSRFESSKRTAEIQFIANVEQRMSQFLLTHKISSLSEIHSLEGENRLIALDALRLEKERTQQLAEQLNLRSKLSEQQKVDDIFLNLDRRLSAIRGNYEIEQKMRELQRESAYWYRSEADTTFILGMNRATLNHELQTQLALQNAGISSMEEMNSLDNVRQAQLKAQLAIVNEMYKNQAQGLVDDKADTIAKEGSMGEQIFGSMLSQLPGFSEDAIERFRALSYTIYNFFKEPLFTFDDIGDWFSGIGDFFDDITRDTIWDTNDLGKRFGESISGTIFDGDYWAKGWDNVSKDWDSNLRKMGESWDGLVKGTIFSGAYWSQGFASVAEDWNINMRKMGEAWDSFMQTGPMQTFMTWMDKAGEWMTQSAEGKNAEAGDSVGWVGKASDEIVKGFKIAGNFLMKNIFVPAWKIMEAVIVTPLIDGFTWLAEGFMSMLDGLDKMLFGPDGFAGLVETMFAGEDASKEAGNQAVEAGSNIAVETAKTSAKGVDPVTAFLIEVIKAIVEKLAIFNRLMEVFEDIISNIAHLLDVLFEFLEPLLEAFYTLIDDLFRFLQPIFRIISSILKQLAPILKLFTDFMAWLGDLLGMILGIFGLEMDSKTAAQQEKDIEASQKILEDLLSTMEELNKVVKEVEETIRSIRYSELNLIGSYEKLAMAEKDYQRLLVEAQTGGADEISALAGFAQEYLGIAQGVEKSSKAYEVRYKQVLDDLDMLGGVAMENAKTPFQEAKNQLDELGEVSISFGNNIGEAIQSIKDGINSLDEVLDSGQSSGPYQGKNIAEIILDVFVNVFGSIVESAAQFLEALLGWIPTLVSKAGEFLQALFAFIGNFGNVAVEFFKGLWDAITSVIGGGVDFLGGLFGVLGLGGGGGTNFLTELTDRLFDALGFGSGGKKIIPIIPGWLLGQDKNLVELEFTWGQGGLLPEHANGGNIASDGGLAVGPSHQSGMLGLTKSNSPFLFEGGEYIVNKKAVDNYGVENLDEINSYASGGTVRSGREEAIVSAYSSLGNGISQMSDSNKISYALKDPHFGELVKTLKDPNLKFLYDFLISERKGLFREFGVGGSTSVKMGAGKFTVNDARSETPDWLYPDVPEWAEKAFGLPDRIGMQAHVGTNFSGLIDGITQGDSELGAYDPANPPDFSQIKNKIFNFDQKTLKDIMHVFGAGFEGAIPGIGSWDWTYGDGGMIPEFGSGGQAKRSIGGKINVNNMEKGINTVFGPVPDPSAPFTGGQLLKQLRAQANIVFPEWNKSSAKVSAEDWELPNNINIFAEIMKRWKSPETLDSKGILPDKRKATLADAVGGVMDVAWSLMGAVQAIANILLQPFTSAERTLDFVPKQSNDGMMQSDRLDRLSDRMPTAVGPYSADDMGPIGLDPETFDMKMGGKRYVAYQLKNADPPDGGIVDSYEKGKFDAEWAMDGARYFLNEDPNQGIGKSMFGMDSLPNGGKGRHHAANVDAYSTDRGFSYEAGGPGIGGGAFENIINGVFRFFWPFRADNDDTWGDWGEIIGLTKWGSGGLMEFARGGQLRLAKALGNATRGGQRSRLGSGRGGPPNTNWPWMKYDMDFMDAYSKIGLEGPKNHRLLSGRPMVDEFGGGGLAHGPSHDSGNMERSPFDFLGGEYIINKDAVDSIGVNNLDKINRYGQGGLLANSPAGPLLYEGGEYVMNKETVNKMGVGAMASLNSMGKGGKIPEFREGGWWEGLKSDISNFFTRNTESLFGSGSLFGGLAEHASAGRTSTIRQMRSDDQYNSKTHENSVLGRLYSGMKGFSIAPISGGLETTVNNIGINTGGESEMSLNRGAGATWANMQTWQEPWRGHQGSRAIKGTGDHWGKTTGNLGMNKPDGTGDRWDFNRGAQGTLDGLGSDMGFGASASPGSGSGGGGVNFLHTLGEAIIDLPTYLGGLGTGLMHNLGEEWETAKRIGIGQYLADAVVNTGEYLSGKRKLFDDSWGRGALYKKWYNKHIGGARHLPQLHQDALALNSNIPRGVISSAKYTTIDSSDVQGGGLGRLFGGDYSNFSAVALDNLIAIVRPADRGGQSSLQYYGGLSGNPEGLMFGDLLHEMVHVHQHSKVKGSSQVERFSKIVELLGDGEEREAERVRMGSYTSDRPGLLWSETGTATKGGKTLSYGDPTYESFTGNWRNRVGGGLWATTQEGALGRFNRNAPYKSFNPTMWHFLPFLKTGGGGMMRTHRGHNGQQHQFGSVSIDHAVAGMGTGADAIQGLFPSTDGRSHSTWGQYPSWSPHNVGWAGEAYPRSMAGWGEGGLIEGREFGGAVNRNQTYLVGENGPELFRSKTGGEITPHIGSDNDLKNLVRELIGVVKEKDMDVHVYTDLDGSMEEKVEDFRVEMRERINREQRNIAG